MCFEDFIDEVYEALKKILLVCVPPYILSYVKVLLQGVLFWWLREMQDQAFTKLNKS